MHAFRIIMLLAMSAPCFAGEVDDVIKPLGLAKEELKEIWFGGRCDPEWKITIDQKILNDRELLGYKGLMAGFFKQSGKGNIVTLRPGAKCIALNKYYFLHEPTTEIHGFIELDKAFIEKYSYSAMDAIYVERTQFHSWNGVIGRFHLNHIQELSRKGLFTLMEKESEFNGKPSTAYIGERTAAGDRFHDRVFK